MYFEILGHCGFDLCDLFRSIAQFYYFMKTTVAPSNLNITVLIGVGAYSNPSKFQKDSIISHGICHCKNHGFPEYCIHFQYQGQHLNTAIENVWKTMIFKMAYLMTYKCYPFKIWRGYCRYP